MKSKLLIILALTASIFSINLSAQDVSFYYKYAKKGDVDAMCNLAECYYNGQGGVKQDFKAALSWYDQAARKGNLTGQFMVAYCCFYQIGTTENFYERGFDYLKKAYKKDYIPAVWLYAQYWKWRNSSTMYLNDLAKAAEGNYGPAQSEYGLLYLYGSSEYNLNKDVYKAAYWLEKAAANGNSQGMFYIGLCYENGLGVAVNETKALEYYYSAAQLGHVDAMASMGYAYLMGEGVEEDYSVAYQYLKPAADQNSTLALGCLGDMYYYGLGFEEDDQKAMQLYKSAADLGHTYSMCQLADMYIYTETPNYDMAYKYYKQAADKDSARGQCGLGDCWAYGYGVDKNNYLAFQWYKKSADNYYPEGLYNLAYCYLDGTGVSKNGSEYIKLLEQASELGYTDAKSDLAVEYYLGEHPSGGVNLARSIKLFKEAASEGDVTSQIILGQAYYTGTRLMSVKDFDQAFIYLSNAISNSRFKYMEDATKAEVYRYLSACYRYGRGCAVDQSLASYYTEQAAKYGDEGSKRAAELLRRK